MERRDIIVLACGDGAVEERLREVLETQGNRANGQRGAHERMIKIVSVSCRIDASSALTADGPRIAAIVCDDLWSGEDRYRGWALLHDAALRMPSAYRAMIADDAQREFELRLAGGQTWPRGGLAETVAGICTRALIACHAPCAVAVAVGALAETAHFSHRVAQFVACYSLCRARKLAAQRMGIGDETAKDLAAEAIHRTGITDMDSIADLVMEWTLLRACAPTLAMTDLPVFPLPPMRAGGGVSQ